MMKGGRGIVEGSQTEQAGGETKKRRTDTIFKVEIGRQDGWECQFAFFRRILWRSFDFMMACNRICGHGSPTFSIIAMTRRLSGDNQIHITN
jgi:hypothetical protein